MNNPACSPHVLPAADLLLMCAGSLLHVMCKQNISECVSWRAYTHIHTPLRGLALAAGRECDGAQGLCVERTHSRREKQAWCVVTLLD